MSDQTTRSAPKCPRCHKVGWYFGTTAGAYSRNREIWMCDTHGGYDSPKEGRA